MTGNSDSRSMAQHSGRAASSDPFFAENDEMMGLVYEDLRRLAYKQLGFRGVRP